VNRETVRHIILEPRGPFFIQPTLSWTRVTYPEPDGVDNRVAEDAAAYESEGLPNRLLNAREVAKFVGCHEETVRRAYWRGLLRSQRFGVRGRRFHPEDVLDWIARGAPTRIS
jgi:excisionase family DNA binding protein